MIRRGKLAYVGVALVAVVVGVAFLRNPKLGDDFTYWRLAFELHDHIPEAWSAKSFHALRWPVWGVSWLIQSVVGPGLFSFYGVPLLYLMLGAMLAYGLAQHVLGDAKAGWMAAIAYLFHPLIDSVVYRPMPDLSEGVLGAGLIWTWLAMAQSSRAIAKLGFAALAGFVLALLHSNRFSGLLMIPVLVILTTLFFPRQFHWLLVTLGFAAIFIGVECALYHSMTGDWLHSLHANMGARGKKGTETIALWRLPLRFIDSLFKGNRLSAPFMLATIAGGWAASRSYGTMGRVAVAWSVLLYLGYSCAIQSVNPIRPMLRDADRFLGSLAIPFAVLIAAGLRQSGLWLAKWSLARRAGEVAMRRPRLAALSSVVLLFVLTSREFFETGYIPPFRAYLQSRPPGTHVFTHRAMRSFAFLMDGSAARRIEWFHRANIIERDPRLEAAAARANEFWYIRKLVWLRQRKDMLYEDKTSPKVLASYFDAPYESWKLQEVLCATDNPEFVFYRGRQSSDPPARIVPATDLPGIVPALPVLWDRKTPQQKLTWPIPGELRGRLVQTQIISRSNAVQPVWIKADFVDARNSSLAHLEVKPHVYPTPAKDFFAFKIPACSVNCVVKLKVETGVTMLELQDVNVIVD
jgi:hypothetical protein